MYEMYRGGSVLAGECGEDGGAGGIHDGGEVVAVGRGFDGAVDGEADVAGTRDDGGARHYAEGTVDGDRYDGEAEFDGEGVCPALEAADGSCARARAFGEDDDGHALVELSFGGGHGGADCRGG